jgi:hypothetical protein
MEIVGLKKIVDDDVNKLIAKFVGYRSKPAQVIQNMLNTYCFINGADYLETRVQDIYERRDEYIFKFFDVLMEIQTITERRRRFEQLPQWVKKSLIIGRGRWLFPIEDDEDYEYLKHQVSDLNFKVFNLLMN